MNATQIIKENRKPNTRYATNAAENVIAQWLNDRWTIIHVYTLLGKWINGGDGLLVNGKPIVAQDEFIEVHEPHATLGQLQAGQWFSFIPNPNGIWSYCYQYQGNGWYGRAYSGGPWHKPNDTQVYLLRPELQDLCNKQQQALFDEHSETERSNRTDLSVLLAIKDPSNTDETIESRNEPLDAVEASDAYNTGFEAAKQGEDRTANPHADGTWDSNAWFAGWDAQ